ncbi:CvpA family protein [Acetobacteraceae bacterium KSS8]|uniref:CvpA family protein n=1 Tax=Endosaccharibacter trunci TaxID=2812733 RepID=A0ABT1W7C3_9PROT|nr:CvpA family protein [Acetobacteraceae bacterium KSS8]
MNWVDIAVLILLALSALLGLARGFIREALGLAAWVGAALLAARLGPEALPFASRMIPDPSIAGPVAFLVVFAVLLVVFLLVAAALGSLARGSVLGGIDRLFGFLFGLLRGFAVLVIAAMLAVSVWPVSEWPTAVAQSRFLPPVRASAAHVSALLPDRYRPEAALSGPDDFLSPPRTDRTP